MSRKLTGLLLFLAFMGILSCHNEETAWEIELPPTPILTGTTGWGVVNTSYLKIYLNPDDDHYVVTTLREGDIVKIVSVHYLKNDRGRLLGVWYHINWGRSGRLGQRKLSQHV